MNLNTLVLLPGLDGTGLLFEPLVSAFPANLRIKVVAYPGQRFLSYSELIPFVQETIPTGDPYVIVAESFSTPLAVMLAAAHPPNLAGLILAAGFITSPLGKWSSLARPLTRPLLFRIPPPSLVLKYFVAGFNQSAALEASVRRANQQVDPTVIARRALETLNCDAREELARTKTPLMYIQGENDHLVRRRCFEEIRRIRPDVVLATIRAPHLVLQREPKKAAEIIVRFMNSIR